MSKARYFDFELYLNSIYLFCIVWRVYTNYLIYIYVFMYNIYMYKSITHLFQVFVY